MEYSVINPRRVFWRVCGGLLIVLGLPHCSPEVGSRRLESDSMATRQLRPSSFVWHADQRYTYRWKFETRNVVEGQAGAVETAFRAELELVPGPSNEGRQVLNGRFTRLETADFEVLEGSQASSDEPPSFFAELQATFALEFDDGQYVAIRHAPGLGRGAIAILRTLASDLSFGGVGDGGAPVVEEAFDATGAFTRQYVPEPGTQSFRVSKTSYHRLLSTIENQGQTSEIEVQQMLPSIVKSQGQLSIEGDRLQERSSTEVLAMTMILGAVATTSSHRRLEWVQSGENMATEPAPERRSQRVRLAATEAVAWEGAAADLDVRRRAALGFDEALALLLEYERTGRDEALLTGEDGRAVRGPERQRRQTGLAAQAKAFSVVQSHLRHDPRLVARVMEHVHAAPERTTVILDALSSASTPGAQAALRSLMLDPSLPDAQRRSIASRLIRTPSPNATTVDVFIQKLYDPILGRYAIYGLGTMARKLRKRGSSARARQLHDRLAEGLAQAREPAAQIDFLRGLANSADPGNVELVSPWLKHAHKGIRGAAFQALRLISGPKVEQLLRHSLRAESTNTVRRTMLASLLRREPSDVLVDVIRDIALNSEDLASRYRSVKVLQRWSVAMPELRRDLAEIAKTDEHDRVRALAAMSPATAQRADTIG